MKRNVIVKIETNSGNSDITAATRITRRLEGVEWSDINTAATELTITYDDRWLTWPGITASLKEAGFTCKIFAAPSKLSDTERPESRAARKIRLMKEARRREALRSPRPVCGCC